MFSYLGEESLLMHRDPEQNPSRIPISWNELTNTFPDSIVAWVPGCHAADPDSSPDALAGFHLRTIG